ncbi:response regulator transcription factor [Aureitalea sp. L0-47]|uniref:LytR/AlgR family response regulator transcription factor n=1 Tax=Aureitalea sp. L0-47 TaxID=2816962 RepID=UPI002237D9FE|nr:LytTR family DNA-binding domain-containing protein [Aureitalea sp. L0-47]MCW5519685.1 response regulator transcription factor [Aureitalea sp. L0-47]
MLKAIIVDDETRAIKNLKWEIDKFCPELEVVECFSNPVEAISGIDYLKPDCVFLDIEMPQMDGFQLLKELRFRQFNLIITTAYDNYAIKAFKENAIDYLLKPIDSDDLTRAVAKIINRKEKHDLGFDVEKMLSSINSANRRKKISIPLSGKTLFVHSDEVVFCKSDGNYTEFYLADGRKEVITKNLKEVHEELLTDSFCRIHNSYCVNIEHIREYIRGEGYYLIMTNDHQIPVSRSRRDNLMQRIAR